MSQTQVQDSQALKFGSVKLLLGDDAGSLVDVGALRGFSFESKAENSEVQFDNCPSITKFMKGDRGSFKFSLAEINLETLKKTDDGLVNIEYVAGTPVNVSGESVTLNADQSVALANKNGANTRVGSIVVTGKTEGVDYEVFVDANGYTRLTKIGAGSWTANVAYTYTPNQAKKITFNTTGQKIGKYARIINTDSTGKEFRIDIQDVTNITPLALPFVSDNADDVMVAEMELEGTIVEVIDEQDIS